MRRPVVLVMSVVAALLLAAGVVLLVLMPRGSSQHTSNAAVVDHQATAQVVGQVDTALQHVLSYQYKNPDATRTAAQQTLVGAALKQYNVLFAALQKKAGGQQLTLVAKVINAGVVSLSDTRAELLVFLDQTATRASDGKTSTSPAQIRVAAVRTNGTWRISELVPL